MFSSDNFVPDKLISIFFCPPRPHTTQEHTRNTPSHPVCINAKAGHQPKARETRLRPHTRMHPDHACHYLSLLYSTSSHKPLSSAFAPLRHSYYTATLPLTCNATTIIPRFHLHASISISATFQYCTLPITSSHFELSHHHFSITLTLSAITH